MPRDDVTINVSRDAMSPNPAAVTYVEATGPCLSKKLWRYSLGWLIDGSKCCYKTIQATAGNNPRAREKAGVQVFRGATSPWQPVWSVP